MARVVRRTSSQLVRPPKRAMRWLGSTLRDAQLTINAGAVTLDQSFSQAAIAVLGDFTIVRIRGLLSVASDQSVATEEPFGALGVMVVKEPARAAGTGSLPRPYDEAFDSGWLLHQFFRGACRVGTDTGIEGGSWWNEYVLDVKSMRKVQSSDAIVVLLENANATAGLVYRLDFRMLIKIQ